MSEKRTRRSVVKALGSTGILAASSVSALSGTATARNYTIDTNLNNTLSVTGAQLDEAIRRIRPDSPLIGLGDTWVAVGNDLNINEMYMVAHAAWESAWGTSSIAQQKNNIYGYDARDACPLKCADGYASFAQCIREVMPIIKNQYLTPGGKYYEGATLRGMNVHYATDTNWKYGIADTMDSIDRELPSGGGGFSDGDRVTPTASLNTRKRPGTESSVVATITPGEVGEIMNGPTTEDGYTWWGVHWLDRDVWGWSVERYLDYA